MFATFIYIFHLMSWPIIGPKSKYSFIPFTILIFTSIIAIKLVNKYLDAIYSATEFIISVFLPVALISQILPRNDDSIIKLMIVGLPISLILNIIFFKTTKQTLFGYLKIIYKGEK